MVRTAGDSNLAGIEFAPVVDQPRPAAPLSGGPPQDAGAAAAFAADAVGITPALSSPGRALSVELPQGLFDSPGAGHLPDHAPPFRKDRDAEPLPAPHPPEPAPDAPQDPEPLPVPSPPPAEPLISTATTRTLPPDVTAALAEMDSARLQAVFDVLDSQLKRHAEAMELARRDAPRIAAQKAAEAKAIAQQLQSQANVEAGVLAQAIEQTLAARRDAALG